MDIYCYSSVTMGPTCGILEMLRRGMESVCRAATYQMGVAGWRKNTKEALKMGSREREREGQGRRNVTPSLTVQESMRPCWSHPLIHDSPQGILRLLPEQVAWGSHHKQTYLKETKEDGGEKSIIMVLTYGMVDIEMIMLALIRKVK